MNAKQRLILLSFLMLFVELALIRWTGSNVVYLSYFSNFILLASFLGIGIGFLRGRARTDLFQYAPVALALLIGFVLAFRVEIDRSGSDLIYFGSYAATGLPIWLTLPVIFIAVAAVMAMLAEGVARTFIVFRPLEAYRLDIIGSVLGIAGFSLLSFAGAPPVVWGVVSGILLLLLSRTGWWLLRVTAIIGIGLMLGRESMLDDASWSPYYKIRVAAVGETHHISVNGIPHQVVSSVEDRREREAIYFLPYERGNLHRLDRVLVVGAGNGGDVAIALEEGARHVDAVEIDPRLQQLGVLLNPDRPYDDSRVDVIIDDGRAYLERTEHSYDLILFGLPDSLTLVSGQSSLRLESYLFTREALAAARDRLKPGGTFAMYNYYREQWLIDRLGGTLAEVYGHPPCVDRVGQGAGLAALTISRTSSAVDCRTVWQPSTIHPPPATDDHPFLYLRERSIPDFYVVTIALILLASLLLIRVSDVRPMQMSGYGDLFLMGVAFLLLETKSIVQFALLFGTTWFVNALVFAGILVSVLAAIEVTKRLRLPAPWVLYATLVTSVLVGWVVVPGALLGLPFAARFVAAVLVWFTPIFLANLIFAQRFRDVGASNVAFGANLLGAMVGGILEYAALLTGYQTLALVVAVLYMAALALSPAPRGAFTRSFGILRDLRRASGP